MFRHRRPTQAFSDFINWTDYRWEPSARLGGPVGSRPWGPNTTRRRGYSVLQVFLAGLAVVVGLKLMSELRNRGNRSFLEKGVLAVLLLLVASYVSKRRPV